MLCLPLVLAFTSCKDDDDNDDTWRNTNEAAFNAVATSTEYQAVTTPEGPGTIYKKVIKSGVGTEKPIFTSTTKVFYKGMYYDKTTVFDPGTSVTGVPVTMPVYTGSGGVIAGMSIALQNMVVGDKWEIWIPWDLGYGSVGKSPIPGYTTLVFEVELLSIDQYPYENK